MNAGELMKNASKTAAQYFLDGVHCIDEKLGEGYAANHPARVGRNKRSALRRIGFEWPGHGEGSGRDPASYGFAQPALRELAWHCRVEGNFQVRSRLRINPSLG